MTQQENVEEIVTYYTDSYQEDRRLTDGFGLLERTRTQALITRCLPPAPAEVLDVGGAAGVYAFFMAGLGYNVQLIDIVPKHIEQAQATATGEGVPQLVGMQVGDARALNIADQSVDAVIMHGPLYHLIQGEERIQALEEAWRVLRPGGVLLAFAITRTSGAMYGISKGLIYDTAYRAMIAREVETGRRTNVPEGIHTLPNAYFHRPEELCDEIQQAGFSCEALLGVTGPVWLVPDLDAAWQVSEKRQSILEVAQILETEPCLSPTTFALGRKSL